MELDVVQLVGTGGVAGVVLAFLTYFIKNRSLDQKSFETLQNSWIKEITRLQAKHDDLMHQIGAWEQKYQDLNRKVETLKTELNASRRMFPDLPIPLWMKDKDGYMISLNDAYEKEFLKTQGYTRSDYIGFTDDKIWGYEVAEHFRVYDELAKVSRKPKEVIVEKSDSELLNNWTFYKYPKYVDGILVGIGGIAIPKHI